MPLHQKPECFYLEIWIINERDKEMLRLQDFVQFCKSIILWIFKWDSVSCGLCVIWRSPIHNLAQKYSIFSSKSFQRHIQKLHRLRLRSTLPLVSPSVFLSFVLGVCCMEHICEFNFWCTRHNGEVNRAMTSFYLNKGLPFWPPWYLIFNFI